MINVPPPTDEFLAHVDALQIAFDEGDLEQLRAYLQLLLTANESMNLTAITEPAVAWTRHLVDALAMLPYVVDGAPASCLDVGSGGGVPGLPLAIVLPEVRFTLLEATGKKARFLEETARALGLDNVRVIAERAETAAHEPHLRERFPLVIARAVGPLNVLLELTMPFVETGGRLLAVKGERAPDEIRHARTALRTMRSEILATPRTPTATIVVVQKLGPVPARYPRRPGEPKKSPL